MPTDSPPRMPGSAPGSTTEPSTRPRPPPIVRTASSQTGVRARTACRVETITGKNAAVKVMKTIPCSLLGKSRIATGTSAIAGMGRRTSRTGPSRSAASRERATAVPTATPATAASTKPVTMRVRLSVRSCQYVPLPIRSPKARATSVTVGNCSKRSHRLTSYAVSSCHRPSAPARDRARTTCRDGLMTPGLRGASAYGSRPRRRGCAGDVRRGRRRGDEGQQPAGRPPPRPPCPRTRGCRSSRRGRTRPGPRRCPAARWRSNWSGVAKDRVVPLLSHTSLRAGAAVVASACAYRAPSARLTYRSSTKASTSTSPTSLADFSTGTSFFRAATRAGLMVGSNVAMPFAPL